MASSNMKAVHFLAILVIAIVLLAWNFGVVPAREKRMEYSGEITELSRKFKWWTFGERNYSGRHRQYNYYWHIQGNDGQDYKVRMGYYRWKEGEPGVPVKKVQGERYPVIDTHEYREQQELKRESMEMLKEHLFRSD